MSCYVASNADGVLVRYGLCPADDIPLQGAVEGLTSAEVDLDTFLAISAAPARFRFVEGAVVERALMAPSMTATAIVADGNDAATISGLPDPCRVTIRGVVQWGPDVITGGALILTSTVAGPISITVEADPDFAPWSAAVDAT